MDKKNSFKELQDIIDKLAEINKKLKEQINKNKKDSEQEEAIILPFKKKD